MPIDPRISLGLNPVKIDDPLEQYGKIQNVRNMIQQGRAQDLDLQQREQDSADEQVLRQAYGEARGDLGRLRELVAGRVSPQRMAAIETSVLERRQKLANIGETELKNLKAKNQEVANSAAAIINLPPDKRPTAYQSEYARLVQQGILPKDSEGADYPGDDGLELLIHAFTDADKQFTMEMQRRQDKRQGAEHDARMPGLVAESTSKQSATAGQLLGEAKNQVEWEQALRQLPWQVAKDLPARFSPEAAQRAARMGMTAHERTSADSASKNLDIRERELAKPNTQAELAIIAADPNMPQAKREMARAALKLMENKPAGGGSSYAIAPYVKALELGQMAISGIPAEIRDKVLADAQAKGISIVSDSEREKMGESSKMLPVVEAIGELSEKINTGQGVLAKIGGGVEQIKAKANLDDDVAEYESLILGFTPLVARAVGHTGILTQQDVDSVKAMFPRPGDSKSLRDRKMDRLKKTLSGVREETTKSITEPINSRKSQDGGMVKLRAPDGSVREVPAASAEHYIKLGAKRVQ